MEMTTHKQALDKAVTFWDAKGNSGRVMAIRAGACIKIAGGYSRRLASLSSADGTDILSGLRKAGLGRSSVIAYYAAYRRMLALSGVATVDWPGAGAPARRVRTPINLSELDQMIAWMRDNGREPTADLLAVLKGTGQRIRVEALSMDAGQFDAGWLQLIGKGDHERLIPVTDHEATDILITPAKQRAYQGLSYERHRQVWHEARKALGLTGNFTPHSIRHAYATKAYAQSGKNLIITRDLLGHSDINTTAGYIGVDKAELLEAMSQ